MSDYEIGRGRPPKKHQWKKGQSGNPKGRPRKQRPKWKGDDGAILRRLDAEEITLNGRVMTMREAELRRVVASAVSDRRARKLLDRVLERMTKPSRGGVVHMPLEFFQPRTDE
jgi:hypothetical protein